MTDENVHRVVKVNKGLRRVYKGTTLIGHVRQGLDHQWYPELESERHESAAIHALIIAYEAKTRFLRAVSNGSD